MLAQRHTIAAEVAALVEQLGPLGALDRLDEARAVSLKLAAEARERGQHHTAAGLDAAADRLWRKAVHLTETHA